MMESSHRDCPLCARRYDDPTDLRVHLMTDHRKSDLTSELVRLVGSQQVVVH